MAPKSAAELALERKFELLRKKKVKTSRWKDGAPASVFTSGRPSLASQCHLSLSSLLPQAQAAAAARAGAGGAAATGEAEKKRRGRP
jgi:hypothetical protein